MEMSFAELKILNAVGVTRTSVGKFFQAIPKIKKKDQLSKLFLLISVVQRCGIEYKI
jgi:hypothetical protein